MPNRKADVTKAELERYAAVMREAKIGDWRVEVERPDGTKVSIVAGKASEAAEVDDIDAMIERLP